MNVDIVGGGAIGLLYGARLAEAGASVTVWTRSKEQALLLKEHGIRFISEDGSQERIAAVHSEWIGNAGSFVPTYANGDRWVLLTVKQPAMTDELLTQLKAIVEGEGPPAPVVCLQNGIGHLDKVRSALVESAIYAAVTSEGARRHDACTVQHTGSGELWFGKIDENESKDDKIHENKQKMLISRLQSAGIAVFLSNDMENRIYNKLLINAVINPLTAMYNVRNGELPQCPIRYKLMQELYRESEQVLLAAGMKRQPDGWQRVLDVCKLTSGNVSSMLGDVLAGRETEIASINGGIVALSVKHGLQAPLNRAVAALIDSLHPRTNKEE